MSSETFGQEVKRRREALNMSQSDLANLAGISRNTVSNIEREQGQTDKRIVEDIRKYLAVAEVAEATDRSNNLGELVRDAIARKLDSLADGIPQALFPPDSVAPEAVALRVARDVYRHAASIVRGESL